MSETRVVLDADFLSALLKIDRLSLIKDFYGAEYLLIPPAVYREVSQTSLLQKLAGTAWLRIEAPRPGLLEDLFQGSRFDDLGAGERESIALVHQHPGAVLLMNDNRARRQAIQLGVDATNIPTLLLAFKLSRFLDRDQIAEVIRDLQEKDRYGFRADVLARLLE